MAKQQLTPRINRNESNLALDSGAEIWPEGTSRSVASGNQLYGSIMTRLANVTSSVTLTNSRQTSVPAGANIPFSNQVSKTAAGTLAAGTNINLSTFIEGYDVDRIYNKDFSVIFWVKSSVASTRSVALNNASLSHTYIKQYTIASANTWQLVALSFPALNTCPGTIERTNLAGLQIVNTIVAGSTFQTATTNAWVAGNFRSGVGEDTTWLTGTTHDFSIAGMQVLPGDWSALSSNTSAYTFLRCGRNFQEEVEKTQRYFEKSYNIDISPASNIINGMSFFASAVSANYAIYIPFASLKRADPTLSTWDRAGNSGRLTIMNSGGAYTDNIVTSPSQILTASHRGIWGNVAGQSGSYTSSGFHWVADARF